MKTKIQIKHILGSVLFEYESENNSVKETVEKAVKNGASLNGAILNRAILDGASLNGASLDGAILNGEILKKVPLQILGLRYFVFITQEQIKIGCELHKVKEWKKFDNETILRMDGKEGLMWWKANKKFIFECHKKHTEKGE